MVRLWSIAARRCLAGGALVLFLAGTFALPVHADITDAPGSNAGAMRIGQAIVDQPGLFVGACWTHYSAGTNPVCGNPAGEVTVAGEPGGVSNMTITDVFGPPTGLDFGIITSGSANFADDPDPGQNTNIRSRDWGDTYRGANDVVILAINVNLPGQDNCIQLDVQFLSEEYPNFVGSAYNDAFMAEIDSDTWSVSGSTISSPDNWAVDDSGSGQPMTINAAGSASMASSNAVGSVYGGATPRITIQGPTTPGPHIVYLSIFDAGDHIYDSAIFMDNMRSVQTDPRRPCTPGLVLDPPTPTHAAFKAIVDSSCGTHPVVFDDKSVAGSIWGGQGTIVNWTWEFGDGEFAYTEDAVHMYSASGTYRVSLTVTDADGRVDTAWSTISVKYKECPPPPTKAQDDTSHPRAPRDGTDDSIGNGDYDADGVANSLDDCPRIADAAQTDTDADRIGDACDDDADADTILNDIDDCPLASNSAQADLDADGIGDVCDNDVDGDARPNLDDNCVLVANPDQLDADGDLTGDACDGANSRETPEAMVAPAVQHEASAPLQSAPTASAPWLAIALAGVGLALVVTILVFITRRR